MKTGDLEQLSVQEIVDCSDSTGNTGCDGGYFTKSWEYVVQETGIATELDYAYLSEASLFMHIQHHVHIYRYVVRICPAREHTFTSANTRTQYEQAHALTCTRAHAHTRARGVFTGGVYRYGQKHCFHFKSHLQNSITRMLLTMTS